MPIAAGRLVIPARREWSFSFTAIDRHGPLFTTIYQKGGNAKRTQTSANGK